MANGMGSLYVGASGLQNSQNALNTTANNMANVDTKGYVRQQVLFSDRTYNTFDKTSGAGISFQQAGLGVNIADVVHSRDQFLDKYYRTETGRLAFYEKSYEVINEVEDLFQELEGATYQDTLNDFWVAFQELSKEPDSSVKQNLVVQKATLFMERAQSIYASTISYQKNMNVQIIDQVERVNELGNLISDLNEQIRTIESADLDTAMTLRDERDKALDELGSLIRIDYKETPEGAVKVRVEGVEFVDEVRCYEMGLHEDKVTDFMTPYWPHLSDEDKEQYYNVFDFTNGISSYNDTDLGSLKALVLSRGDRIANYTDIEGVEASVYNKDVGQCIVMNAQAELDQLIHKIVTSINDILCPNTRASFTGSDGKVYKNVKVWDEQNGCVGTDGVKPGHELFVRRGCERYKEVTSIDGKTYYVYNEENMDDTSQQYTVQSLMLNEALVREETYIPHIKSNGEIDYGMAAKLAAVWSEDLLTLNPNNTDVCSFVEYYERMIDSFATEGSVYNTLTTTLEGSSMSIENQRQQVIGVSSDEELTNMIKYQNAYNAASRYINVISEMLEHLIMQLGS